MGVNKQRMRFNLMATLTEMQSVGGRGGRVVNAQATEEVLEEVFTISGAASHSALVLSLSHSALREVPLDILQDAGPVWTPLLGGGGIVAVCVGL